MFREFPCGCIVSEHQGRVRVCGVHRPERGDGIGGLSTSGELRGRVKYYPANGEAVAGWTGR